MSFCVNFQCLSQGQLIVTSQEDKGIKQKQKARMETTTQETKIGFCLRTLMKAREKDRRNEIEHFNLTPWNHI